MSTDNRADFRLWHHVYLVAEAISRGARNGTIDLIAIENHLTAVEEVFADEWDPHRDFRNYVLLHLCRSIRRSLTLRLRN
jgi:hypothetical protein